MAITWPARGTALICIRCGSSWLAARKSFTPICADCKADEPARPKVAEDPAADMNETLTCEVCGSTWERTRSRGRKPLLCAMCH
jgi:DNA polymerase-3 subunit epsilon